MLSYAGRHAETGQLQSWRPDITVVHLLQRQRPQLDVAILESSAQHLSPPGWPLVGVARLETV
jgi:hypothetical protein